MRPPRPCINDSLNSECSGRRRLRKFMHGKEYMCQSCWEWLKSEPYCLGGMTICHECPGTEKCREY